MISYGCCKTIFSTIWGLSSKSKPRSVDFPPNPMSGYGPPPAPTPATATVLPGHTNFLEPSPESMEDGATNLRKKTLRAVRNQTLPRRPLGSSAKSTKTRCPTPVLTRKHRKKNLKNRQKSDFPPPTLRLGHKITKSVVPRQCLRQTSPPKTIKNRQKSNIFPPSLRLKHQISKKQR